MSQFIFVMNDDTVIACAVFTFVLYNNYALENFKLYITTLHHSFYRYFPHHKPCIDYIYNNVCIRSITSFCKINCCNY